MGAMCEWAAECIRDLHWAECRWRQLPASFSRDDGNVCVGAFVLLHRTAAVGDKMRMGEPLPEMGQRFC